MRALAAVALVLATSAALAALEVGAPAPALDGVTWLKGEPAKPGSGTVTVVEFWATWCGPCKVSIPHLSALQKKHDGKVVIIGLSDEERAVVEPFVADQGAKMDYRVGLADETVKTAYMDGVRGIPHAFLIGADGTVLWQGHPAQLDQPLAQVVDGTWDPSRQGGLAKLHGELEALFNGEGEPDFDRALAIADQMLAIDPVDEEALQVRMGVAKRQEKPELFEQTLKQLPIDQLPAERLNGIAWDLLTDSDLGWRFPAHALRLAQAAMAKAPRSAAIADTWARALYTLGLIDDAIAAQRHAVELAKGGEEDGESLERGLAYYEQIKALQATTATALPKSPAPAPVEPAVP